MVEPLSFRRKFAYGLCFALLVLAAAFGTCEVLLRAIGYGHSPRLFRLTHDSEGRGWWRENRWVTAPYFSPELVRFPQVIRIPAAKGPQTYRVFVLGSSAAMGDPEPAFSLSRTLGLLLRDAYPSVNFEVVNAGITAINSNVVRTLARDCAGLQPDLFIVYEGNNEVIGPYGPGTVFSPFLGSALAVRSVQALRSTRTGQLLTAIARRLGAGRGQLREWGGMGMFLKSAIDRDDPRLGLTRRLFRDNLLEIADSGRQAGATVMICTVLANQKDFAPFLSRHRAGLSDSDLARWQTSFDEGRRLSEAGNDAAAEPFFRRALAMDDHYAELPFQLGRLCLREGRNAEAKALFARALDLDLLRFRTDSQENDIIRSLATKAGPGPEIVDLAGIAERESPQGILGDEFLYEHVHLNFQGTYLMARELFGRVSADLERRRLVPVGGPRPEPLPFSEARRRLAYTAYEQAMIIKEMIYRLNQPPFTAQSDNADMRRRYELSDATASRLLERPGVRDGLVFLYENALSLNPGDWLLERNTGMALVGLGLPGRGRAHLERALSDVPDDADTVFALATACRQLGDTAAAEKAMALLKQLDPAHPGLAGRAPARPPPPTP
jgi:tetratricopeptide (TPR) repeat protein